MAGKKITAWSYSRLSTYRSCPLKAKLKFIDRLSEPSSEALELGAEAHKQAELYVNGQLKRLPAVLKLFRERFKELRKANDHVLTEVQWAFTSQWKSTEWFGKNAWCRMVIDALQVNGEAEECGVIDYKTGKVRETDEEQLTLYALGVFLRYPNVNLVTAELWYLSHGEITQRQFERAQLSTLKKTWNTESRPMLRDTRFKPTPSYACRWCHFGSGGIKLCQY